MGKIALKAFIFKIAPLFRKSAMAILIMLGEFELMKGKIS